MLKVDAGTSVGPTSSLNPHSLSQKQKSCATVPLSYRCLLFLKLHLYETDLKVTFDIGQKQNL